jgi:hypothetical protein
VGNSDSSGALRPAAGEARRGGRPARTRRPLSVERSFRLTSAGTVALSDQAYNVPTSKAGSRRDLHWFARTRRPISGACWCCQPEWDRLMQRCLSPYPKRATPGPAGRTTAYRPPHGNADAAEQGQPGDVLPEDRSAENLLSQSTAASDIGAPRLASNATSSRAIPS